MEAEGRADGEAAVHRQGGRRRNKSALKKATRFTSHFILNSVLKSYKRSHNRTCFRNLISRMDFLLFLLVKEVQVHQNK